MATIHLHARTLLLMARDAVIRGRDDAQRPNALTADAIVAILLSAASAEAFINEFAAYAPAAYASVDEDESGPGRIIAKCAQVVLELEDLREPVESKYLAAAEAVGGPFNKGAAPYQDFGLLIDLRNGIMHLKGALDGDPQSGQKAADALGQRGIAIASTDKTWGSLHWFDRLMTPAVALWAHDSALALIAGFWERVPLREYYDPLGDYRRTFREHPSAG